MLDKSKVNKTSVLDMPSDEEKATSPTAKCTVERGDVIHFQGSPKPADDLDKDKDIGKWTQNIAT